MILAGVDAGATTTRAVAADEDGHVVGRGEAGPGNPSNAGIPSAASAILGALREATVGRTPDVVMGGVAGIEEAGFKEELRASLQAGRPALKIHLVPDAAVALDGAFLGAPGIIVIAGTGSVTWGRDASGREARAGGWGHVLEDAGSGYDVGREALRAVLRAYDGRGAPTGLTARVLGALHVERPDRIVGAARTMSPAQIAALAPFVMDAAEEGDDVAGAIVREAGRHLAEAVAAVWRALGFRASSPVAGIGGLFAHPVLRRAFAEALSEACPGAMVTVPRLPPAGGALWRAFVSQGIEPPERLIRELAGQ